jgi:hypothetical protein
MKGFRIAINMAGAISAGAYTAGVLDFLTEALDAWTKAKAEGAEVPQHEVMIEAFSGASAGGMCATISAMLLQDDFEHVSDTTRLGTTNRFYEAWVNQIDIRELLKTRDLEREKAVVSLLDSTILDDMMVAALKRRPLETPRPYVSPDLTVFLSLTNLRGVLYSLNSASPGSVEETTSFFGDRIRFQTVREDSQRPLGEAAYPVDLITPGADMELLGHATLATGAFPVFLAPRVLTRRHSDYTPPLWEQRGPAGENEPPPVSPSFPPGLADPFATLNVDGGVTNNDPYNYSHDYLASLDPPRPDKMLERDPFKADRAVVSIAPFPTTETYAVDYDARKSAGLGHVLGRLFHALMLQSRFFGESLSHLMRGTTFSHFMVAPSDHELVEEQKHAAEHHAPMPKALQCGLVGKFGGFFDRGFRAHDYSLGRRNCQKFLLDHFIFPAENVVMKEALGGMEPEVRERMIAQYRRESPKDPDGKPMEYAAEASAASAHVWLPMIPLCTPELRAPIPPVPRYKMKEADMDEVVRLVAGRFEALTGRWIGGVRHWGLRQSLRPGPWVIARMGRGTLKQKLAKMLGDSYEGGK